MHKKILIVGADGMIGSNLFMELKKRNLDVVGTSRKVQTDHIPFDLKYPEKIHFPSNIGTAFICAAISGDSLCKKKPGLSWKINVDNTLILINQLMHYGIHVVYLSSDAAFFQNSEYGRQKRILEEKIEKHATVVRMGKVFGILTNRLDDWLCRIKNRLTVTAFDNLFFSPILLENVLSYLISLVERTDPVKTWLTSTPWISYHQALCFFADHLGYDKKLIRIGKSMNPNYKPIIFPKSWNYIHFNTNETLIRLYERSYQGVT